MPGLRPFTPESRDGDADDENTSPEALLISAFLHQGRFEPEKYHVTSDMIDGWGKVWATCRDYRDKSKDGAAPSIELIQQLHPEFTPTAQVDVSWAAAKVRDAAAIRDLRNSSRKMLQAVGDEDLNSAFDVLESIKRPRGHRKEPISVFDHSVLAEDFDVSKIEVPFPTLQRASKGGVSPGEFWVLAARLSAGKTHIGLGFMATAAMQGMRCAIASYEMPAKQVNMRLIRKMAGRDGSLLRLLDSEDEVERKKGMDAVRERVPGEVHVFDPSHGQINSTGFVRELCGDYEFVMLDHLGLMMNNEGKRAIDDWRVQAWISNVVRETTLATSTPVLALAQVNRSADTGERSLRTPKASELSQSDAIGQDADAVVTMKRLSKRVMRYEAVKLREGPSTSWYSRFEPERNRFDEISREAAEELRIVDSSAEDL